MKYKSKMKESYKKENANSKWFDVEKHCPLGEFQ